MTQPFAYLVNIQSSTDSKESIVNYSYDKLTKILAKYIDNIIQDYQLANVNNKLYAKVNEEPHNNKYTAILVDNRTKKTLVTIFAKKVAVNPAYLTNLLIK